ncbi:MAG TPA: hypothetical protein VIL09_06705 [Microvirga sp.]
MSTLIFEYEGNALARGIEASELRQVIDGYNRLVMDAAHLLNGDKAGVSFRIKTIKSNSLDIETVVEIAASAQATLPLALQMFDGIKTTGEMIKTWLDIQKHLRGESPRSVQSVRDGNAVKIENNNGQILIVNGNVYGAFNTLDVGQSAQKIAAPFKRQAENLTIKEDRRILGTFTADDAAAFKRFASSAYALETKGEVLLTVKSPILEGDGLWRFRYGSSTIVARMNDNDFKQQVENGNQTFRHGDIFRVELHSRQEKVGRRVKTSHAILKVIGKIS